MKNSNEDKQENKNGHPWYYELIKYPVVMCCIVLGVIGLAQFANIEFDKITKISTSGIEFASEKTNEAVIALNDSIKNLNAKLNRTESDIIRIMNVVGVDSSISTNLNTPEAKAKTAAKRLEITEIESDAVAGMSYIDDQGNTRLEGRKGYIWLGAYYNKWLTGAFICNTAGIISAAPKAIACKQQYTLSDNLKLRIQLPQSNDSEESDNLIGIIPQDTPIKLISVKEGADNQYWAHVKVMK